MAERQTGAYQTTVRTQEKGSKDHLLSIRSQEGERIAMKVLTPTALKIYLYATSNANGYHFLLCSKDITEKLGISRRTYTSALADLIDNGFLIKRTDGSEIWDFYDNPPISDSIKVNVVKTIQ